MLKINKKVEYALMVLKYIVDKKAEKTNSNETLTTAREVCEKFNIPFDTTAKVMQVMNTAGILDSTKGVKGGYFLKADLNNISYLELSELIEGKKFAMDCVKMKCSLIDTCNITTPVNRLNQYLTLFFQDLSLKDLLIENNLIDIKNLISKKETQHEFN
tara:strand:+ start:23972 stop:24448 length:477 start_codon:yes stop_codon:yes gene_type:complete